MTTNGKTRRTLTDRLKATAADFDERIKRLQSEKSIALGKIKANAKAGDLAEAKIDVSKDVDFAAFIASKSAVSGATLVTNAVEPREKAGKGQE